MSQGRPIVMKFGGSSVATPERIRAVAKRIAARVRQRVPTVVVVSAMGKTTDGLIALAGQVADNTAAREMDMLLATGEQVSIALLAMALHDLGASAVSFTGDQAGVETDAKHSAARITHIDTRRIQRELARGRAVIVAGFQGRDAEGNITTLGRGGSDTSAVALAAAFRARSCEIYTDVGGVFTADPRVEPAAQLLPEISCDEMLELASMGSKVLHSRSVEFAKKYGVEIHVRSSFNNREGTRVVEERKVMESVVVRGVTHKDDEIKVTVRDVPDRPGVAGRLFGLLAKHDVVVNMIVQSASRSGIVNDISFTAPVSEDRLREIVPAIRGTLHARRVDCDPDVSIVSLVGVGMRSHSGVASRMFAALARSRINIQMIATSEIKISVVVGQEDAAQAVRCIHREFGLSKGAKRARAGTGKKAKKKKGRR